MIDVDDLIGTPFVYGGRPENDLNGLDCYGLVQEIQSRIGVTLPPRSYSEQQNVNAMMMQMQMQEWEECERKPGAVILFRIRNLASHVGVIVSRSHFAHTWEKAGGVCLERISEWEKRIVGIYRYAK
jgi:cell wall-associated NlpC family hydrolase